MTHYIVDMATTTSPVTGCRKTHSMASASTGEAPATTSVTITLSRTATTTQRVTAGSGRQFYNGQSTPVEAKHNYWGAGLNNSTIDASICDDEGAVWFYPFETEPLSCAPTPDKPPAFTSADAVIALHIAVGSREYDRTMDVNNDGMVTSFDALIILHAVAG